MTEKPRKDPTQTIILNDEDIDQLDALSLASVLDDVTESLKPKDGAEAPDDDDQTASPFGDLEFGLLDADEDDD